MKALWRTPLFVLCGTVAILLIANGSRQNFGLFLVPISGDLGWGRAEFSFAIAIQNIVMGLAAPFVAAIGDKWGPIRVMAASAAFYAFGVYMISISGTPEMMTVSAGLLVGIGASGIGFTLPLALVGRVAQDHQRSLWLGVVTAGGSVGQFVFAPVSQGLISGLGWSDAIVVVSIVIALTVPLSLALGPGSAKALSAPAPQSLGAALTEAGGHRGYWLLVTGFFVCGFQVQFIGTHLPGFITDSGQDAELAAWALAFIGLFNLIGTLAAGWLGGQYRKKYLLSMLYLLRAAPLLRVHPAPHHGDVGAGLRRDHGPPLALHGAADQRDRRPDFRPEIHGDAVLHRLSLAPARQLLRGVARRHVLRPHRELRCRMVACHRARHRGGADPLADRRQTGRKDGSRTGGVIARPSLAGSGAND